MHASDLTDVAVVVSILASAACMFHRYFPLLTGGGQECLRLLRLLPEAARAEAAPLVDAFLAQARSAAAGDRGARLRLRRLADRVEAVLHRSLMCMPNDRDARARASDATALLLGRLSAALSAELPAVAAVEAGDEGGEGLVR